MTRDRSMLFYRSDAPDGSGLTCERCAELQDPLAAVGTFPGEEYRCDQCGVEWTDPGEAPGEEPGEAYHRKLGI